MAVSAIETGDGTGYLAKVDSGQRLHTFLEELTRVLEPVTTRPEAMEAETLTPTAINGASSQIAAAKTGVHWLEVQNIGDFPVHILLASNASTATTAHRRLDPGEAFKTCGATWAGAIQAIAVGGNSEMVIQRLFAT